VGKQATKKITTKVPSKPLPEKVLKRLYEGASIVVFAISLFLLLALFSYDAADPSWSYVGSYHNIANAGGQVGAWFADVFLYVFGYLAYLFPLMLVYSAWLVLRARYTLTIDYRVLAIRTLGFVCILLGGCGLANLELLTTSMALPFTAGGILGDLIAANLERAFNPIGAMIFSLALFLMGITLYSGLSWLSVMEAVGRGTLYLSQQLLRLLFAIQVRVKIAKTNLNTR